MILKEKLKVREERAASVFLILRGFDNPFNLLLFPAGTPFTSCTTVKTRINGPCARTLDLPLLVRSVFFYFLFVSGDAFFGAFSPPFPEEEISDYIAHGPFIRVFTVYGIITHHS